MTTPLPRILKNKTPLTPYDIKTGECQGRVGESLYE